MFPVLPIADTPVSSLQREVSRQWSGGTHDYESAMHKRNSDNARGTTL